MATLHDDGGGKYIGDRETHGPKVNSGKTGNLSNSSD